MSGQRPNTPTTIEGRMDIALQINEKLASCYHWKFQNIPRDEFLSAGLVGIARANKQFKNGNWCGYVKVSIQNEMLSYCRRYKRYVRLLKKAYKICQRYHYIIYEEEKKFIIGSNTRPQHPRTGRFMKEKAYYKLLREQYNVSKNRDRHILSE